MQHAQWLGVRRQYRHSLLSERKPVALDDRGIAKGGDACNGRDGGDSSCSHAPMVPYTWASNGTQAVDQLIVSAAASSPGATMSRDERAVTRP